MMRLPDNSNSNPVAVHRARQGLRNRRITQRQDSRRELITALMLMPMALVLLVFVVWGFIDQPGEMAWFATWVHPHGIMVGLR